MTESEACLGFSLVNGIGPLRFKLLLDYFKSPLKAWQASEKKLKEIGLGPKLTADLISFRKDFDPERYRQELAKKEIRFVAFGSDSYPPNLLDIPDPPIGLFIKGRLPTDLSCTIGIVGTRKVTNYGRQVTVKLTQELVSYGFTIISGLALGVDGIAHQVALERGGNTIAVLGCGVDIVYPPEHNNLYSKILLNSGCIISEVPPGHTVKRGLFPARNRIISGLSLGVLITEGAENSGSLITARFALDQGREVFAVPGPVTSYLSAGPSKLIKQGAKLVSGVEDILEEIDIEVKLKTQSSKLKTAAQSLKVNNILMQNANVLSQNQQKIVALLKGGEIHFDDLVRGSGLTSSQVGTELTSLELFGIIQALGNGKYALV